MKELLGWEVDGNYLEDYYLNKSDKGDRKVNAVKDFALLLQKAFLHVLTSSTVGYNFCTGT